jgi:hypothetical protein
VFVIGAAAAVFQDARRFNHDVMLADLAPQCCSESYKSDISCHECWPFDQIIVISFRHDTPKIA